MGGDFSNALEISQKDVVGALADSLNHILSNQLKMLVDKFTV